MMDIFSGYDDKKWYVNKIINFESYVLCYIWNKLLVV